MKTKLSKDGPELSQLVIGVWKWGSWGAELSIQDEARLIEACCDMGITSFDHADIYGDFQEEERFGRAFNEVAIKREDIQLITKCGIRMMSPNRPENRIKSYDQSKTYIRRSVETSLKNLQTDYLDVLLIHRPSPLMNPEEIAEVFTKLQSEGKVKHFGVSNFNPSQFDLLNSYFPLCTNQVECSLVHLDPIEDGTFDQAIKGKARPMIWSPLGSGKLFGDPETDQLQRIKKVVDRLCGEKQCTATQIYLSFLLHHPAQMIPVLGTSKIIRVKEAIGALNVSLTDEEWFDLYQASIGKDVP